MRLRPAGPADLALLRYWDSKPHIVVATGEDGPFQMRISDQAVIAGSAPIPMVRKVRGWARRHHGELLEAWEKASNWEVPKRID